MKQPKRVICLCIGNSDRSPVMAAVLRQFLSNNHPDIQVESAGVGESASNDGGASQYAITAANRIGINLTSHRRHRVTYTSAINLCEFDLVVCASDDIAAQAIAAGARTETVYTVPIANPWPVRFQEDYDSQTMPAILAGMYLVVCRFFGNVPNPDHGRIS